MKISFIVMAILLLAMLRLVVMGASSFGKRPSKKEVQRFSISKNYNPAKNVFINRRPNLTEEMRQRFGIKDYLNFLFKPVGNRVPPTQLPLVKPVLADFLSLSEYVKVIWLGHSSFLLNMNGRIVLVDPVFYNAAPFRFMAKRFQPSPLTLEELPAIDYIVISHNHYAHLDRRTVQFFKNKEVPFLVPLGVDASLIGWGIDAARITALDWWQCSQPDAELEFIFTPSQHASGRGLFDQSATLWGSWVIRNKTQKIYFSGDSGYDIHFKEIGMKYGPFDVAFVETGQYNNKWEEVHLLPPQSVQAVVDLNAKSYFPVHWGVFNIAYHPWFEPIQKIYQASQERHFPLFAPKMGEIVEINAEYQSHPWWEKLFNG